MNLRNYFLAVGLVLICARVVASAAAPAVKWHPGHYIYVGHGNVSSVIELKQFRGVQKFYTWTKLEPEQGRYDFSSIRNDLALLKQHGKQLVIQLQYKAFVRGERFTPSYIRGPEYGGGVFRNGMGAHDPVLWNSNVGERMDALYAALGRAFDSEPGLEAAVLPETSPCHNLEKFPQPGIEPFTTDLYVAALKQRMLALRKAFPNTAVIQYVNYPKQVLPQLTDYMKDIGVGIGGPDFYPRPSALSDPEKGVYRLYPKLAGTVPLGAAVQAPDYSVALWKRTAGNQGGDKSPVTAEDEIPIPIRDFLKLAQELNLNYLFWQNYPPSCFENVKTFLAELDLVSDPAGGLATQLPSKVFLATASETKSESAKPLAPPAALHAADFYVATNGSDRNPGTKDKPFKTIQAGIDKLMPGNTLIILPGVYRESLSVMKSGTKDKPIRIEAQRKGTVSVRGSCIVREWVKSQHNEHEYIHEGWDKYFGEWDVSMQNGGDTLKASFFGYGANAITFAFNQLFADGSLVREVACHNNMQEGTFYTDKENKRIHLWLRNNQDPATAVIEVTDKSSILRVLGASCIQVRGIDFMHAANDTQRAAVDFCKGTNNLIEDCSISHAAMGGLNFWFQHYSVARRCIINSNGQQGICGYYSVGSLYEDCETSYNNRIPWKKVDIEYQCGGFKMLYNYKVRFIRHQAHQNIGPGLWFDMSNEETEVANCFASGNMIGTFNEISFKIHIHDSVFIKNKGAGVGIAESPGATIERNIFYDNDEGLNFRGMDRVTKAVESKTEDSITYSMQEKPIWNHEEIVRKNIFCDNKTAHIRIGVDRVNQNRQLPKRFQKSANNQPIGLSFEDLHVSIDDNGYFSRANIPLIVWDGYIRYTSVEEIRANVGLEEKGIIVDPVFCDPEALDFRISKNSEVVTRGCYPEGTVPGVKLGFFPK